MLPSLSGMPFPVRGQSQRVSWLGSDSRGFPFTSFDFQPGSFWVSSNGVIGFPRIAVQRMDFGGIVNMSSMRIFCASAGTGHSGFRNFMGLVLFANSIKRMPLNLLSARFSSMWRNGSIAWVFACL